MSVLFLIGGVSPRGPHAENTWSRTLETRSETTQAQAMTAAYDIAAKASDDAANTHSYVGQVVTFWLSRNMGCFTRDIHACLTCSWSAAIGKP